MAINASTAVPKVLLLHCPGDKIFLHDYYTSYSSKANYYWPPTDLVLLSGVLRETRLAVIDAVADRLSEEACLERIRLFAPDVVVFTSGTATWKSDFAFAARVKTETGARLVATGSIFFFEAERFLAAAPHVDAAILDMATPEIVDYVHGRERDYTALAVRRADGLSIPAPASQAPVVTIPVPRHDLFNLRANRSPLARRRPFALVVTSIGCPFGCVFCVAGAMAYRSRGLDGVLDELEALRDLGVREIMFNDPTFTVSKKRVLELCAGMENRGLRFSWVCNAHITTLDEELAAAMKKAGCHTVMIGVESGQEEILAATDKKITREKALRAFAVCKRFRIRTLAYFIVGLPGETPDSVGRTIRFAKELDPDFASFSVLTPDIGSPLRAESITKGLIDPDVLLFDSTCQPVFSSGSLSLEELWRLRQKAVRSFYLRPAYLLKQLGAVRSLRDFLYLLDQARTMFFR
ncbi:MAG: radical SAM protein [Acidobacteriota bacterium]|nr:radical SAM protein [Acidobacteriota bacterium]MDW3225832.1 radical SAM protein [Acidobacteriota bacterium]